MTQLQQELAKRAKQRRNIQTFRDRKRAAEKLYRAQMRGITCAVNHREQASRLAFTPTVVTGD